MTASCSCVRVVGLRRQRPPPPCNVLRRNMPRNRLRELAVCVRSTPFLDTVSTLHVISVLEIAAALEVAGGCVVATESPLIQA